MSCCSIGGCGLLKAVVGGCAIAFVGIAIGSVHSWMTPVVLRPDASRIEPTVIKGRDPKATQPNGQTPTQPDGGQQAEHVSPVGPQDGGKVTPPPEPTNTGVALGFEIKSDQAKMLFDMGTPFIDAREPQFFAQGHVERAMNMTADQVIGNAAELIRYRPGPIVVYCSGGDCDASHHVATRLQALQFTQIHIMIDGYPGWKEKGFPVVEQK
jgi:rhodanese-related sulfurtransferase